MECDKQRVAEMALEREGERKSGIKITFKEK